MRKVLAALLVLGMLLTFVGCSESASRDDSYKDSYTDSYPTTVATTTAPMWWDDEPDEVPITTDGYYGDNVTGNHYNPTEVPVEVTTTTQKTTTRKNTQTSCDHWWYDATCTEPSKCYRCNKTQGKALGHSWIEATCDSPKKCSRCYTKVGEEAHVWSAATCTENQKCTLCGDVKYQTMLGHDYKNGFCTRCNRRDENYMPTYTLGQTWVVDGEWEFTINSVTVHPSSCLREENAGKHGVLIEYTYKNIGYTDEIYDRGLSFDLLDFQVYDEKGRSSDWDLCKHDKDDEYCIVGTQCTASALFALPTNSSKITVVVLQRTGSISDSGTDIKAKFNLTVSNSDTSSGGQNSDQYYLGSSVKKVEYVIPYTSCSEVKTGATSAGYNLFYYYRSNIGKTQFFDYCDYVEGLGATLESKYNSTLESMGMYSNEYSIDGISFYCTYQNNYMIIQFYDLKSLPSKY